MPTTVTCPSCGAEQSIPDNTADTTCVFCGTHFSVGNAQVFPQLELSGDPNPYSPDGPGDEIHPPAPPYQTPDPIPQVPPVQADYIPADRIEVLPPTATRSFARKTGPATWIAIAVLILLTLCLVCGCLALVLSRVSNSGQY